MYRQYEGKLVAQNYRFGIIVSRFNEFISSKLLSGALDAIKRHDGQEENVKIVWVPGSMEIPLVAQKVARGGRFDAVICLGAVIRGSTPHFDYVAAEVAKGINRVALDTEVPVVFGVLTCDTLEQAIERAGTKVGNKGWDAAVTAMEMADLGTKLKEDIAP